MMDYRAACWELGELLALCRILPGAYSGLPPELRYWGRRLEAVTLSMRGLAGTRTKSPRMPIRQPRGIVVSS
jgi:hypothetical protein